jgi:hypothetical protein
VPSWYAALATHASPGSTLPGATGAGSVAASAGPQPASGASAHAGGDAGLL